jgi:hypothetical protein
MTQVVEHLLSKHEALSSNPWPLISGNFLHNLMRREEKPLRQTQKSGFYHGSWASCLTPLILSCVLTWRFCTSKWLIPPSDFRGYGWLSYFKDGRGTSVWNEAEPAEPSSFMET